jgi:hypothetical protein
MKKWLYGAVLSLGLAVGMLFATGVVSNVTLEAQENCFVAGATVDGPGWWYGSYIYSIGPGCYDGQQVAVADAWFHGWSATVLCDGGGYAGNGHCNDFAGPGHEVEAYTTAQPLALCGGWSPRTASQVHFYDNNGNHQSSSQLRTGQTYWALASCDSGEPEECDEGYYWDDSSEKCIPENCPVILPMGQSQDLRFSKASEGVLFDINGDGVKEQVSWPAANTDNVGFLFLDRNGNGAVDSGAELIGNASPEEKGNGFDVLIDLAPGRYSLTTEDVLFQQLQLWQDRNRDGVSQQGELQPLSNIYSEIGLGYIKHNRRDGAGNKFKFEGWAIPKSGTDSIRIYDVFLALQ